MPTQTATTPRDNTALHRAAVELTHQLGACREWDRLETALTAIPVLMTLYEGETTYEVLQYWKVLDEDGRDIEVAYASGLARWHNADTLKRSEAQVRVAGLLEKQNRLRGAITHYTHAEMGFASIGNAKRVADTSIGIAHCRFRSSEYNEGLRCAMRALEAARSISYLYGEANALRVIGNIHTAQGNYVLAKPFYEQGFPIYESLGDRRSLSGQHVNYSMIHIRLGQYAEAMDHLQTAKAIMESIGERSWMCQVYINLANVHFFLGDDQSAEDCIRRSLYTAEGMGDKQAIAISLTFLGKVLESRGSWEEALALSLQSLTMKEAIGDKKGMADSLQLIGNSYKSLGNGELALDYMRRSLEIFETIGDQSGVSSCMIDIGVLIAQSGRINEGIDLLESAMTITVEIREHHLKGDALHALGEVEEMHAETLTGEARRDWLLRAFRHLQECVEIGVETQTDHLIRYEEHLLRIKAKLAEA